MALARLFVASVAVFAASCSQVPSRIGAVEALGMAATLRYIHDERTGLCFAVVASRHVGSFSQSGFTITWVPCTPAVVAIIRGE